MSVNLATSSDIGISVYSMSGRKVYDFKSGMLKPGLSKILVPFNTLGSGVYVVSVLHDGNRSVFRYFSADQKGSGFASFSRKSEGIVSALQKTAADESDFIDSLVITADGLCYQILSPEQLYSGRY